MPIALSVLGGRIRDVQVDGDDLVPTETYHVIPDPRPITDWVLPDLRAHDDRFGLRIEGTSDAAGQLTADARCRVDGRWVANAVMGQVAGPFSLTVAVPAGRPCQLHLAQTGPSVRRALTACLQDEITPGSCPEVPPTDPSARERRDGAVVPDRVLGGLPAAGRGRPARAVRV